MTILIGQFDLLWNRKKMSCIPDKVFRDFHQCWQILSYIPLSDPWDKWKTNNNTCCQYIGYIGGHVTLSLRRWEVTSVRRHIRHQLSILRTSRLVNDASYVKIKRWRSKGMQEQESIMAVGKIRPSGSLFGITCQSLVMRNNDPRTDFSIRISHPWKILLICYMYIIWQEQQHWIYFVSTFWRT